MGLFKKKDNEKYRIDAMNSHQKADMIKRLERERRKINSEIESVLKSYAKESGNRELKRKRARRSDDWTMGVFKE